MSCPRCKGKKVIRAYDIKNGQRVGKGEDLPCPTCRGTGDAHQTDVDSFKAWQSSMKPDLCVCTDAERQPVHRPDPNGFGDKEHWICGHCGKKIPQRVIDRLYREAHASGWYPWP